MLLRIIKKKIAPEIAPVVQREPVPAVPSPASPTGFSGSSFWEGHLLTRPDRKAVYDASRGLPIGQRAIECKSCGKHYIVPCLTNEDTEECPNRKGGK